MKFALTCFFLMTLAIFSNDLFAIEHDFSTMYVQHEKQEYSKAQEKLDFEFLDLLLNHERSEDSIAHYLEKGANPNMLRFSFRFDFSEKITNLFLEKGFKPPFIFDYFSIVSEDQYPLLLKKLKSSNDKALPPKTLKLEDFVCSSPATEEMLELYKVLKIDNRQKCPFCYFSLRHQEGPPSTDISETSINMVCEKIKNLKPQPHAKHVYKSRECVESPHLIDADPTKVNIERLKIYLEVAKIVKKMEKKIQYSLIMLMLII